MLLKHRARAVITSTAAQVPRARSNSKHPGSKHRPLQLGGRGVAEEPMLLKYRARAVILSTPGPSTDPYN